MSGRKKRILCFSCFRKLPKVTPGPHSPFRGAVGGSQFWDAASYQSGVVPTGELLGATKPSRKHRSQGVRECGDSGLASWNSVILRKQMFHPIYADVDYVGRATRGPRVGGQEGGWSDYGGASDGGDSSKQQKRLGAIWGRKWLANRQRVAPRPRRFLSGGSLSLDHQPPANQGLTER